MDIKNVTLIYFSPTDSTRAVGELIAGEFRAPISRIDITGQGAPASREFGADELAIVAVPSYGGRVPAPAAFRLMHFLGRATPAISIATFGNRAYDDTLRELSDILTGNGFLPIGALAAATEHSIIRKYGAGRPDERDRAELKAFGIKARVKLGGLKAAADGLIKLGGDAPYRKFSGVPVTPVAGQGCTGCGICASNCPVGAIDAACPRKTDGGKCICCMRCVKVCPNGARALPGPARLALTVALGAVCAGRKPNATFL